MAITINQWPVGGSIITMAHNPVEFVVTSTNTAQQNFKYIADLTWTSGTTAVRYIQGANPINGKCRFDFSSVLRNVVTFDPPVNATNDFYNCVNSYSTIYVKFGEQYGPTSGITNYENLATDGMYICNACLPIDRWWNLGDPLGNYAIQSNKALFLTDVPRGTQSNGVNICYNDLHYLYFLQDGTNDNVYQVKFVLYKNNIAWNTIYWECPNTITNIKNVVRVGVGPKNLQDSGSELNYITFQTPSIDEDVEYYSVQLIDDKSNPLTEEFWFNIECECAWESPYRLCFLNKLGGYDFFNFSWNSKKTSSYQKSFFERKAWNWNNGLVEYNSHNRGKVQYSTIGTDKLQLTSQWITEEQSTWLEELISSPDVYIIDNTNGQLTSVSVTDTSYDYKTLEYDQLFNLTVTLEFAFNRYRQSI